MKFSEDLKKYFLDEKFNSALKVTIADKKENLQESINFLKELALHKNVIHIGAVDHQDSIDRKIQKGNWLHQHFMEVADKCVGIDINQEGIEYLKSHYGIQNIYCADILKDSLSFLDEQNWDIAFLPDVLEHIPDVFSFLQKLHERLKNKCEYFCLTVPNAFCLRNIVNAFKGIEKINSDHKYWFTPYTIGKLMAQAGFEVQEIHYATRGIAKKKKKIEDRIKSFFFRSKPCLRDTIILFSKF